MQRVPVVDELVRAPVDVVILGMFDAAVGCFGDFGRLIARQGRKVAYADLVDQLPVGGAGEGIEIRGLDPEKAGDRLLLARVAAVLNGFENIVRVAAVLGQKRDEVRFGKKLLKARGNGSSSHNCSPCKIILLPIVSHNGA